MPLEAAFLKDVRVDPQTSDRMTMLMAPPATVVGMFVGGVVKDQLTAKLDSTMSGCCPAGICCPKKQEGSGGRLIDPCDTSDT
jgi:hypothetical protein